MQHQLLHQDVPRSSQSVDLLRTRLDWLHVMNLSEQPWISRVPQWWNKFCGCLAVSHSVKTLDLSGTNLSEDNFTFLLGTLKANEVLEAVYLNSAGITDEVLDIFLPALTINYTLKVLHLSRNALTDKGVSNLVTSVLGPDTLTELDLSKNDLGDQSADALVQYLIQSTALVTLKLGYTGFKNSSTDKLVSALPKAKALENLDLNGLPVDCATLSESMLAHKTCKALSSSFRSGPVSLLPLHRLAHLDISGYIFAAEEALTFVDECLLMDNQLSFLYVNFSIDEPMPRPVWQGFHDFLAQSKTLRVLKIYGGFGTLGNNYFFHSLGINQSLQSFDLINAGPTVGEDNAICLSKAFPLNATLQHLGLIDCGLKGAEGFEALCMAVAASSTLKSINLSHNAIPNPCVVEMMSVFQSAMGLKRFIFHSDSIKTDPDISEAMSNLIQGNPNLEVWNVLGWDVGDEGVQIQLDAIQANQTLTRVTLSRVKACHVPSLGQILGGHPSLRFLTIQYPMELGKEDVKELYSCIPSNHVLLDFHVEGWSDVDDALQQAAFFRMYDNKVQFAKSGLKGLSLPE